MLQIKSASFFVVTDFLCAPSSIEKAAAAPKTANTAPSLLSITPTLKNTPFSGPMKL